MNTGEMVRRLREMRGMKVYELATYAGCDPSFIYKLEKGWHKSMTLDKARDVARALDVPPAVFFMEEEGDPERFLLSAMGVPMLPDDGRPTSIRGLRRWMVAVGQQCDTALAKLEDEHKNCGAIESSAEVKKV